MNRKSQISTQKILSGIIIGLVGFTIMSFGAASDNVWLIRGGIVAVTFATWLISWK